MILKIYFLICLNIIDSLQSSTYFNNYTSFEGAEIKILLIGTRGQLGKEFITLLKNRGFFFSSIDENPNCWLIDLEAGDCSIAHLNLDISDFIELQRILDDFEPDFVISCAAATNVDILEKNPITAIRGNVIGTLNINRVCEERGIKQIYFSTEAAYDGTKSFKYLETDAENPQSKYALTKVIADHIVLNSATQAWIFRTSWLYSLNSTSSFVTRILEKSKSSHTNIGVTDDLFGNPTPAWWLASTVINLLKDIENLPTGLYHLCSSIAVSKYDWAKRIITDLNPEKVSLIVPTKRNDFPNAHLRSPYVDLSTDKIQKFLGKSLIPTWEDLWKESIK